MKNKNPHAAIELLKKAVTLKNDIRFAYIDLGVVYNEQKKYDEAIVALKRAVQLDPSQPDAHYRLGRIFQGTGKKAEADKEFATVVSIHKQADERADELLAPQMSSAPPPLPH